MAATRATPKPVSRGDVAALVITYSPDSGIAGRVEELLEQFDRVVLVDNGSDDDGLRRLAPFESRKGVSLHCNGSNKGIATALNQGIAIIAAEGFKWAVTFDQDSRIRQGFVSAQLATLNAHPHPDKVALIGANRIEPGSGIAHRWLRPRSSFPYFERVPCSEAAEGVTLVITSGTMTNIDAFNLLGGFKDELFVDLVDFEYCLRAREQDYAILVSCAAELVHKVGDQTRMETMGVVLSSTHHSPLRRYYLFRNGVWLIRSHARAHPHWLIYQLMALGEVILSILFAERDKWRKLGACILGVFDGLSGATGPCKHGLAHWTPEHRLPGNAVR